ncbi:MAG: helical backbone metal receptor [candidate division WOR-3 bacterium]
MTIFVILLLTYKFVSLVPSVTEIFYLLNVQDSLVAVSYYCNYPVETKDKKKVGDLLSPSYEEIVRLKPDYVIITLPMQTQVAQNLHKLNIKYLVFNPESFQEIISTIDSVSKLTGAEQRAKIVIDSLKGYLREIKPLPHTPTVYVELSEKPLYTVGKNSFLNELIKVAGGRNIFEFRDESYFSPKQEEIVKLNPQFIILIYPGAERKRVEQRLGWGKIEAVKKNQIYTLDPDVFSRPGPRLFEATLKLNRLLLQTTKSR